MRLVGDGLERRGSRLLLTYLRWIRAFPKLTNIDLMHLDGIYDRGDLAGALKVLPRVSTIDHPFITSELDDGLIDALANAKALTSLDLSEGHCDWQSLRRLLSSFPKLQKLSLWALNDYHQPQGSVIFSISQWTEVFRGAPGITHLELGGYHTVTNDLISAMCSSLIHLEELKLINVSDEFVTADCLQHFHKLSRIKILRFAEPTASFTQLESLINACKTLKYLQIVLRDDANDQNNWEQCFAALDSLMVGRSGEFFCPEYDEREFFHEWSEGVEIPGTAFSAG